ncbi:MAG: hypothetical protein IJ033_04670 [Clostridia bacterium]|nr:hypothetical protein [Clostridia bacterium]
MESILIFTDRYRGDFATAVKENIRQEYPYARTIIIDDMDLHANPVLDFIENLTSIKVNKEKIDARKTERKMYKNIDELPETTWEFKEEESYIKMRSFFHKLKPDLVITIGYGAFVEAVATRDSLGVKTKVINIIDDYTLNKSLVSPYLDGYVVENIPLKNKLVECGVSKDKIALSALPIESKYFDKEELKGNVRLFFDESKSTLLYLANSDKTDHKKVFATLKDYDGQYNIIVYAGDNRGAYRQALKEGLNAFNEGASLPMLFDRSDVVITTGNSYEISVARQLGKIVAVAPSELLMEERNATYLKSVVVDCTTIYKLKAFLRSFTPEKYYSLKLRSKVVIRPDIIGAIGRLKG